MMATTASFVASLYETFLAREADPAGAAYWQERVDGGADTALVVASFLASAEAGDVVAPIARLYAASFDRLPDQGGLDYWVGLARGGQSMAEIAQGFVDSAEFAGRFGRDLDDAGFVGVLYGNVLGRAGDAAGAAFWTQQLAAGVSRAEAVAAFAASPENVARTAESIETTLAYQGLYGRVPTAAELAARPDGLKALVAELLSGSELLADFRLGTVGVVADGYIAGATVFLDADGDGTLDEGEISAVTGADGRFFLPGGGDGDLVASGGTDVSTGHAFTGMFRAPAGSTVVNPLSTMVAAVRDQGGMSVDQAKAEIANKLGFDASFDPTAFDPLGAALDDGVDPEIAAAAAQMQAAAAQIATVIGQASALLAGLGDGEIDPFEAQHAIGALADQFLVQPPDAPLDLGDATALEQVFVKAGAATGDADIALRIGDLAGDAALVVGTANGAIKQAAAGGFDPMTMLTEVTKVQSVALGEGSQALFEAAVLGDLSGAVDGFTGDAFEAFKDAAEIGVLAPDVVPLFPGDPLFPDGPLPEGPFPPFDDGGFDDGFDDGAPPPTSGGGGGGGGGGTVSGTAITGTSGDDVLTGTAGNDTFTGGAGQDTMTGNGSGTPTDAQWTVTVAGTVETGDLYDVVMPDLGATGEVQVTYAVQSGDTLSDVVNGLVTAINGSGAGGKVTAAALDAAAGTLTITGDGMYGEAFDVDGVAFNRAPIVSAATVALSGTVAEDNAFAVDIDGNWVKYEVPASGVSTLADVASALVSAINADTSVNGDVTAAVNGSDGTKIDLTAADPSTGVAVRAVADDPSAGTFSVLTLEGVSIVGGGVAGPNDDQSLTTALTTAAVAAGDRYEFDFGLTPVYEEVLITSLDDTDAGKVDGFTASIGGSAVDVSGVDFSGATDGQTLSALLSHIDGLTVSYDPDNDTLKVQTNATGTLSNVTLTDADGTAATASSVAITGVDTGAATVDAFTITVGGGAVNTSGLDFSSATDGAAVAAVIDGLASLSASYDAASGGTITVTTDATGSGNDLTAVTLTASSVGVGTVGTPSNGADASSAALGTVGSVTSPNSAGQTSDSPIGAPDTITDFDPHLDEIVLHPANGLAGNHPEALYYAGDVTSGNATLADAVAAVYADRDGGGSAVAPLARGEGVVFLYDTDGDGTAEVFAAYDDLIGVDGGEANLDPEVDLLIELGGVSAGDLPSTTGLFDA